MADAMSVLAPPVMAAPTTMLRPMVEPTER
jgi:hypothetical protein